MKIVFAALAERVSTRAMWSCRQQGSLLLKKKKAKALLSKWDQTHHRERSPGAGTYRLIQTSTAKSLIFHSNILSISLWRVGLLIVEVLRHAGQTTKHFSAVVKKLWNQLKICMSWAIFATIWYEPDSLISPFSVPFFIVHVKKLALLKRIKTKNVSWPFTSYVIHSPQKVNNSLGLGNHPLELI